MDLAESLRICAVSSCCPSGKIEQHGDFLYARAGFQQPDSPFDSLRFADAVLQTIRF